MANTLKFGAGQWATKEGSTLAYNDENDNYKPLPFTFTRASNATVVNKAGLIETVGNGIPRIDFTDSADGALKLEPQRTNLITYSEDFSSGWIYDDSTITNNSAISPDGTQNAGLWIGSTVSSRHNIFAVPTPVASVTGSFSLFVKAKELKYVQIASANTVNQYVNFDVEDGIIGTVGSSFSNAKIENYGNGWYRCSVVSPNQYNGLYISLVSGLNSTWLESWVMPNNADGLYIWGAQVEALSYPTSYIPTSGSTVTRAAETCNNSGNSEVFSDSEGVLFADLSAFANSGNGQIRINEQGVLNSVIMEFRDSGTTLRTYIFDGNATNQFFSETSINPNDNIKIALKYKQNDCSLYLNGFVTATDTTATMPSNLNSLSFDQGDGNNPFYGKTKELGYYDTALTDAELETLTSYRNWVSMVNELNLNIIYNG